MPNLRKMEITIDFNGNFCYLCGRNWMVNVADTFTDIVKHYVLQTSIAMYLWCEEIP